jgi:peptide/nickel transport system substrate-binding protein
MISQDADRETYITKKDVTVTDFPANTVEFIGFNCKSGAFSDRNVRRAICYAIDCDSIIDMQYYGSGMKNDGLFFPGYMGIDSSELTYPFDTKKAQEALEEAGYDETDENGNVVDGAGNVLTVRIPVNADDAEKSGSAETVAESLEELGIVVTVTPLSADEYYAALKAGEFDLYFGSYTFDSRMDMRALFGYESTNYAGYDNDGLVALLQELRGGSSIEEMTDLVSRIREITISDVPYFCIMYHTYGAIGASTFDGTPTPVWNNYYYNAPEWRSKFLKNEEETQAEEETEAGESEESGDEEEGE